MIEEFRREEERVEGRSAVFRKELGLRDLVLTQIVFVVGTIWVGTAEDDQGARCFVEKFGFLLSKHANIGVRHLIPHQNNIFQTLIFRQFAIGISGL